MMGKLHYIYQLAGVNPAGTLSTTAIHHPLIVTNYIIANCHVCITSCVAKCIDKIKYPITRKL